MEINYEIAHTDLNPEFALQVKRLQRVNPDAVVLWADVGAAGRLVKRMREGGLKMPVFACDRVLHPGFLEIAGAAAEGVVAAVPYNPEADIAGLRRFQEAYRDRYGAEPTVYAAHAYDGAQMVIRAIRKAGLNRYRIRDALAEMRRFEGVTGEILMDDAYSDRGTVTMATVRDGRWVYNVPKVARRF
jgi:branched-chain amino acid transport system substrate-binding protein